MGNPNVLSFRDRCSELLQQLSDETIISPLDALTMTMSHKLLNLKTFNPWACRVLG